MKVVYKYELKTPTDDEDEIWTSKVVMPLGSSVLTAGVQNGQAFIWALVDKDMASVGTMETFVFHIYPTGLQEFDDSNLRYISTIFFKDAKYVFHVFVEHSREGGLYV